MSLLDEPPATRTAVASCAGPSEDECAEAMPYERWVNPRLCFGCPALLILQVGSRWPHAGHSADPQRIKVVHTLLEGVLQTQIAM